MKVYFRYTMDVTTIKLRRRTKELLDEIKEANETYDEAIARLAALLRKRNRERTLIESYKQKLQRDVYDDWEGVDAPWPK
jgi:hypothetical protein